MANKRFFDPATIAALIFGIALFAIAMLTSSARAADGFRWQHFGADPYAASRVEAMKTRESAFHKLGLPQPVIKLFMEETKKKGEKSLITVGDHLSAMLSKGGVVHRNVSVEFGSPVPRMQYAAPAEKWQVSWQGKIYTIFLPEICNNWASITPSLEACAVVEYTVVPGDEVRFAVLSRKRLPSSACWQLCDGADCSAPPSPCDDCDWIGPKSVIPAGFEPLHTGRYIAQSAKQRLRFPREVKAEYIALCDNRTGLGESDSWIIQPTAWDATSVVSVPYGGQPWPAWGQFDLSKWPTGAK